MFSDKRPNSGENRPSSITRSVRCSFSAEFEVLPPEVDQNQQDVELYEEIASEIEEDIVEQVSNDGNSNVSEARSDGSSPKTPESEEVEETELERKIRRGLKKIDKLDKILLKKIHKERKVKRERFAVQRDFQKQVEILIEEKGIDNVIGSQQLLSLCAANESLKEDGMLDSDDDYVGPIFSTQIDSEFYKEQTNKENIMQEDFENADDKTPSNKNINEKNTKKTDFIKRNINLAAHANEVIALTDEEKKRLDELLADDTDLLIGENPFSTPALKDDGFLFSIQDQQTLDGIDTKLKEFTSFGDFEDTESINHSLSLESLSRESDNNTPSTVGGDDVTHCGEKVLDDGQNSRTMVKRLFEIELKLYKLRLTADTPTCDTIDPDLLRSLLEVDSRMTSDSKSICESLRSNSEMLVGETEDFSELLSLVSSIENVPSETDE